MIIHVFGKVQGPTSTGDLHEYFKNFFECSHKLQNGVVSKKTHWAWGFEKVLKIIGGGGGGLDEKKIIAGGGV